MFSEEIALVTAMLEDPKERTARTAYADWIREHGRDREADDVYASLALSSLPYDDAQNPRHQLLTFMARYPEAAWPKLAFADWYEKINEPAPPRLANGEPHRFGNGSDNKRNQNYQHYRENFAEHLRYETRFEWYRGCINNKTLDSAQQRAFRDKLEDMGTDKSYLPPVTRLLVLDDSKGKRFVSFYGHYLNQIADRPELSPAIAGQTVELSAENSAEFTENYERFYHSYVWNYCSGLRFHKVSYLANENMEIGWMENILRAGGFQNLQSLDLTHRRPSLDTLRLISSPEVLPELKSLTLDRSTGGQAIDILAYSAGLQNLRHIDIYPDGNFLQHLLEATQEAVDYKRPPPLPKLETIKGRPLSRDIIELREKALAQLCEESSQERLPPFDPHEFEKTPDKKEAMYKKYGITPPRAGGGHAGP